MQSESPAKITVLMISRNGTVQGNAMHILVYVVGKRAIGIHRKKVQHFTYIVHIFYVSDMLFPTALALYESSEVPSY